MAKAELLYIGTDTGLIQFANPGGIGRWLRAGHSLPGSDIGAIWVHPTDPTNVICSDAAHLYTSSDGGQHWSDPVELGLDACVASRTTPSRILARSDDQAIISHDSGATWRRVGPADRVATNGDTLWISGATSAHTSSDGGTSWHADTPWRRICTSHDGTHTLRISGSIDQPVWNLDDTTLPPPPLGPHNPATIALAVLNGTPAKIICCAAGQCLTYTDSWQPVAAAPALTVLVSVPFHPDRLWGADRAGALWYSTDRGVTWESIKTGLGTVNTIVPARLV